MTLIDQMATLHSEMKKIKDEPSATGCLRKGFMLMLQSLNSAYPKHHELFEQFKALHGRWEFIQNDTERRQNH